MRLLQPQLSAAERRIRAASLVALLLGLLSLVVGVQTWRDRRHMDAELLMGFVDAAVTVALAHALSRHSLAAAWLLLVLSGLGALYTTIWLGFPLTATLPHLVGGIMYARAIPSLLFLRQQERLAAGVLRARP